MEANEGIQLPQDRVIVEVFLGSVRFLTNCSVPDTIGGMSSHETNREKTNIKVTGQTKWLGRAAG